MRFVIDPPIATKIERMRQRVRWQDPLILEQGIDQTRLVLDDEAHSHSNFSFLVIGDTGVSKRRRQNPQQRIAEQMARHEDCRFIVHTGDVVYLVGSSEYYAENFIEPYCHFLVGGQTPKDIFYDRILFKVPFFLVPGNHDYYDLPPFLGLLTGLSLPLRRALLKIDFDIGWHGSEQGKAYARAFLDCLGNIRGRQELRRHLDCYYTVKTDSGRCLGYQPGQFTRLPNRYYMFRYGGIDFFALDSNTFNAPFPIPQTEAGEAYRLQLEGRRKALEQQKQQIMGESLKFHTARPDEVEQADDYHTKIEQIEEMQMDIDKQLQCQELPEVDTEQLEWLKQRLIKSWQTDDVRGRIIFFHHPPYVTETTKWDQAQTLAIRHHLRQVLDGVAEAVGPLPEGRPLVDLILNGHAHCLEHIQTFDTGHADSHLNWIVCGGSGYSLRRQRLEGPDLTETVIDQSGGKARTIARSHLFVGRSGHGSQKRRPYSFLRIDVQGGDIPKFVIRPYISERFHHEWRDYALEPFVI